MAFDEGRLQFYVLEWPKPNSHEDQTGRIDAAPEEGFNVGKAPTCPRCGRFLGMLPWLPPNRLEIETWGRHHGDIARTGDDLIVSERFMQMFKYCGLKGLASFEPAEVVKVTYHRGKPRDSLPRYFKATVVRSTTAIDQVASGYVWEDDSRVCPECLFDTLKRYQCLVIKDGTWNGDDVFYPRGGTGPIVSERFKAAFAEKCLYGAIFIPSESSEAGYDSFPWETSIDPE